MNSIHFYKMCLKKLNFLVLGRQLTSIPDPLTESQKSLLHAAAGSQAIHTFTHTQPLTGADSVWSQM